MSLSRSLAALALLLALAGCQGDPNEEAAQCPKPYLLPDASSLSRYTARGTDLSDLVLSARLTDVRGACLGKMTERQEAAHAHVVMVVRRGPAADFHAVDVPYSVGVMLNNRILTEHDYVQHVEFPPNVDTVQVTGEEINFSLETRKGVTGPNYHLYFWLQLTPEELAANRK